MLKYIRGISLLLTLVLVLTACSSGKTNHEVPAAAVTATPVVTTVAPTPEMVQATEAPDFVQEDELYLYIKNNIIYMGKTTNVEITVLCGDGITQDISIYDENGTLRKTIHNEGAGRYSTIVQIYEKEAYVGELFARAGDVQSSPASYYVQPKVTEEMVARLDDVGYGLVEHMATLEIEDTHSDEALDAAEAWLKESEDILEVVRYDGGLLFISKDHLAGGYGFSGGLEESNSAGFSDAEAVYEEWLNGASVAERFIDSEFAITNHKSLVLVPEGDNGDKAMGQFFAHSNNHLNILRANTGIEQELAAGYEAMDRIASGDFTDYGMLFLGAHGKLFKSKDKDIFVGMVAGELGDTYDQELESLNIDYKLDTIWLQQRTPNNMRAFITYDDEMKKTLWITPSYLEDALGDKTFDNTIIFLFVCWGLEDEDLPRVLFEHGASAIIGNHDEFETAYAVLTMHEMFRGLFDEIGSNATTLSDSFYASQDAAEEVVAEATRRIENPPTPAPTPTEKPIERPTWTPAEKQMMVEEARQKGGTGSVSSTKNLSEQRVQNYNSQFLEDALVTKAPPTPEPTADPLEGVTVENYTDLYFENNIEQIAHDYITKPASILFRDDNYNFGEYSYLGTGGFSGWVYDEKGQTLGNVEIKLYRWLNHDFTQLQEIEAGPLEICTNEYGFYKAQGIPCGYYIVHAVKDGAENWVGISVGPGEYQAEDIILPSRRLVLTTRVDTQQATNFTSLCVRPEVELNGSPEFAGKFKNALSSYYGAYENELSYMKATAVEMAATGYGKTYSNIWIEDVYAGENALSLQICSEDYVTGGAHGSYGHSSKSFDLNTGELLYIEDILNPENPEARSRFKALWQMYLERLGFVLWTDAEDLVENGMQGTMGGWHFTEGGVALYFRHYEASAFNAGTLDVLLPYSQLRGILKEEYLPANLRTDYDRSLYGPLPVGDCLTITRLDERFNDPSRTLYGGGGGLLLAVDGSVANLEITMQDETNSSISIATVFYADNIGNALIMLPRVPGNTYLASWTSGGQHEELLFKGSLN